MGRVVIPAKCSSGALLSVMILLLTGCMLVRDFGRVWNDAKADPCLNKIAESLYYGEFRRDPAGKNMENLARAFRRGGHSYLLLKQEASDRGGRLYRFQVQNGIFQRYRLNPTKRAEFERDHPHAPVDLTLDTVTLERLGKSELALLDTIAADDSYWEIEDQTLYNPIMNPVCLFDDRDLKSGDPSGITKK